ncbi:cell wall-binding repeat-containing protein [Agrococcus baldri]|uniref:cell wall-binding repeat-containing protein n=1 Tax=Agrococcus baldri TaxID=153730 RepID=UPI001649CBA6|nr:cell wall-binding repeat-containing protein [Agrococcus baldri]
MPSKHDWIGGKDLYATSVLMSQRLGTASTVYLTSGESGGDALAVPPAAAAADAHVLMVRRDSVPSVVERELRRLNPRYVNLVGASDVLSGRLWADVRSILPRASIYRVGKRDRVDSALQLADHVVRDNGYLTTAFIIGRNGYSDGLATGNVAARMGAALIPAMGDPAAWASRVAPRLRDLGQVFFIGSSSVLPTAYLDELDWRISGQVERIAGKDRYRTNAAVIQRFVHGISADHLFLVAGNGHGDTIGASLLAAEQNSVMMLSGRSCHDHTAVPQQIDRLAVSKVTGIGTKFWITSNALRAKICGSGYYAGTTTRFAPGTQHLTNVAEATTFTREQRLAGSRYGTFQGGTISGRAGVHTIALPPGAHWGVLQATFRPDEEWGSFSVETRDASLALQAIPIHDFGDAFNGTGLLSTTDRLDPPRYVRVDADGSWTLTVRDMRHAPMLRWSGNDDAIGLYGGREAWITATAVVDSVSVTEEHFLYYSDLWLDADRGESVSGTLMRGPSIVVVDAESFETGEADRWRISVRTK